MHFHEKHPLQNKAGEGSDLGGSFGGQSPDKGHSIYDSTQDVAVFTKIPEDIYHLLSEAKAPHLPELPQSFIALIYEFPKPIREYRGTTHPQDLIKFQTLGEQFMPGVSDLHLGCVSILFPGGRSLGVCNILSSPSKKREEFFTNVNYFSNKVAALKLTDKVREAAHQIKQEASPTEPERQVKKFLISDITPKFSDVLQYVSAEQGVPIDPSNHLEVMQSVRTFNEIDNIRGLEELVNNMRRDWTALDYNTPISPDMKISALTFSMTRERPPAFILMTAMFPRAPINYPSEGLITKFNEEERRKFAALAFELSKL